MAAEPAPPRQRGAPGAPLCIAVVGAESTGKTELAAALAGRLAQATGRRATWVPEQLREWCDRAGRTPRADEQRAILRAQDAAVAAALAGHDIVVADTAPLMIAVYSRLLFGDRSLDTEAVACHRRYAATLLTALDLPWVADGLQRDGPHVRVPVDDALRSALASAGIGHAVVGGVGEARLAQALRALRPLIGAVDAVAAVEEGDAGAAPRQTT